MLPLALSLALLSPAVAAVESQRPRSVITRGDGFVRASVNAISGLPSLRRRQFEAPVANHRLGTQYCIDVSIGTPAQTLTLILDTGSPDLWVNPTCATANIPEECKKYPQFDYRKSKTLNATGFADVLSYGKGNVSIEYIRDTVAIGTVQITQQILGVGFQSHDIPLGILGLSPAINPKDPDLYPFVLDTMKSQGVIKSRAFSLDLRGVTEPEGAIIFGGLDTGKFVGKLEKLPMVSPSRIKSGADRYWIVLTGVGITLPDGTSDRSGEIEITVFPDSGGTLSRLPTPIFQAFGETFPTAQFDPSSGFYVVDCEVASQSGSVDFYFNTKRIAVSYADFIWQVSGLCVLGVLPDDDEPVLGDSFLRAAYVVHDQDNRNLHLAQAADCGSKIVSIGSGANAVPSVTGDCTAVPSATKIGAGFDATSTRKPTNIFTGSSPDVTDVGPGPAGGRTPTGKSGAGRNSLSFSFAGLAAVAAGALML